MPLTKGFNDVCLVILPANTKIPVEELSAVTKMISETLGPNATLITLGEPPNLTHVHQSISSLHYQLWITIKRKQIKYNPNNNSLPHYHFGALVHTRYKGTLKHTITRIKYTYCPACDKTTKDYGGKKHTYNSFGTLISDIWRDIACNLEGNLTPVIHRFADLFGLDMYQELKVLDCRHVWTSVKKVKEYVNKDYTVQPTLLVNSQPDEKGSKLLQGDCLENLRSLPNDSADFAFIDPPYNLGKNYNNYSDDLSIQEYFKWCDEWISEVTRILKPGRTLAILNIPLWAIRHFLYMETILTYQNWIAWDALSFPVRKIMPAHYTTICFSKGPARPLPGFTGHSGTFNVPHSNKTFSPLDPLDEWYCLRASCVREAKSSWFYRPGTVNRFMVGYSSPKTQ